MRCEARTPDDIRALGGNDADDERRFATAARISETNLALYRTFMQPAVRALVSPQLSEQLQHMHPLRLQFEMFSDANPFMAPLASLAKQVKAHRRIADAGNPFLGLQEKMSHQIVASFDGWRDATEALAEKIFLSVYGAPTLQAAAGIDPKSGRPLRKAPKNPLHHQLLQSRIAALKSQMAKGGLRECLVRAALYVGMGRGSVDERGFELIRRIRASQRELPYLPLSEFKAMVRDQFFMLLLDEDAALAAIPSMLPADADARRNALAILRKVVSARGELTAETAMRLERIVGLFEIKPSPGVVPAMTPIEVDTAPSRSLAS